MLEPIATVLTILGAISGATIYVLSARRKTIDSTRLLIARAWTNEGDIHSKESIFITLELENLDGDLVGEISSNGHERLLEAHVNVGWFSSTLHVSELPGRNVSLIGTVSLRVTGNNNRLKWLLTKTPAGEDQNILPVNTVLWPSSCGVSE